MRPASPRSALIGQTPQQRWDQKIDLAVSLLALFSWSNEDTILSLLRVRARGICRRLERAGLIRAVEVPSSKTFAWALTAAGVRRAEHALGRQVRYLSHPGRLSLARFAHELAVQRETILRLPTDLPSLRLMKADRELQRVPAAIRPDLVVRNVDDQGVKSLVCLEVEVSSKGDRELRAKLRAIRDVLTPQVSWRWYLCEGEAPCARYAKVWREVVEEATSGPCGAPAWLLDACRFEVARGTGSRRPWPSAVSL